MKEPGEQEVVVFRCVSQGRHPRCALKELLFSGGDDYNSESANALLSPVQEGATPDTRASRRDSVSSLAEPETPLLENAMPLTRARTADPSFPPAVPMRTISVRPSMDTIGGTSTDSPALSEDQHDFERERGPAPAYRESISVDQDSGVAFDDLTDAGHGDSARVSTVTTAATAITDNAPEPDRPSAQRGSIGTLRRPHIFGRGESSSGSGSALSVPRLLSLFNPNRPNPNEVEGLPRLSDGEPLPATPPSPVIPRHRARGATVATPPGSPRPGSSGSPYRTHRPSHSGSTSALSAMFRTRSNTSGTGLGAALTSPSTLSVHSISAPLTHTVVRTELMYPRAGPTPEQMKLLASVESFQRFGVPYGPDAIAFASSSRVDLLTPPPVFEEVVGQGSAGEGEADAAALRTSTEEAAHFAQDHSPASSPASSPEPSPLPPAAEPVIAGPTSTSQEASPLGAPSPETVAADTPGEEAPSEALAPEEPQPKGPPTLSPYLPTQVSPAQPAEPLTADVVKKILRPLAPPPSSFKVAPAEATPGSARPGSRASSYMTFATAQEGESVPPTPAADAEDHEVHSENTPYASSPSTPKNVLQSLPDTDATTLRDDDGSKTEDAETKMEEAPVASTSSKVAYRKSLDTTSIVLPPAQTEAPPVVAAQSEAVVV